MEFKSWTHWVQIPVCHFQLYAPEHVTLPFFPYLKKKKEIIMSICVRPCERKGVKHQSSHDSSEINNYSLYVFPMTLCIKNKKLPAPYY